MEEVRRRAFCTLMAASAGFLSGCNLVTQDTSMSRPQPNRRGIIVTSRQELEEAFDNLSQGTSIYISAENAPYRTTQWLDIDVDGVTVVGPGIRNLIKPANNANVGGIRIGHNGHCKEIDVRWIGFHGNPKGLASEAKRCHGIIVRDAENVTLQSNYVTRTHPYHVHNAGGSGISVEGAATNIRVVHNRIEDIGDRGIQVAGDGVWIVGNVLTNGFDRSISLDIPVPDAHTNRARNVTVTENILGNNKEGSLIGVGGRPERSDRGYFTISNNVGFGRHKHFCHLGFVGSSRNIQVEGNVSVQNAENGLAGVSADIDRATNVTIRNNALYSYSGRGINVAGNISDFVISGNAIYNPGATALRIAGGRDGTVADNYIKNAAGRGVMLDDARYISVTSNRIRKTADTAILLRGGELPRYHSIADNYVRRYGTAGGQPAIDVHSAGSRIRDNYLLGGDGPAIFERTTAANNRFEGNWSDGKQPWQITSSTSRVRNHTPPVDVHRGVTTEQDSNVAHISFDRPYTQPPRLSFGRAGGGIRDRTFVTDENGNYAGVRLTTKNPGTILDVFVENV